MSEERASPPKLDSETRVRVAELRDRIRGLDAQPEEDFGRFTRWDWICCVVIGILLPLLAVWIWAP